MAGWISAGLIGCACPPVTIAQEAYLNALEAEAGKIEADNTPDAGGDLGPVSDVTKERFEAMLLEQYRGTYGFYQKLLPHIQDELVDDFRSGTAMAELREKIVDRYLQR
jgi:hypothetical protein